MRAPAINVPRNVPETFDSPPVRRRWFTGISRMRSPARAAFICISKIGRASCREKCRSRWCRHHKENDIAASDGHDLAANHGVNDKVGGYIADGAGKDGRAYLQLG